MPRDTKVVKVFFEAHTAQAAPVLTHVLEDGGVQCLACANRCGISEGQTGICRMRFVRDGVIHVPHGYVAGLQADPIEKKPFFHVLPGARALSFGMAGCNLHCPFCQNWTSSQIAADGEPASLAPEEVSARRIVDIARASDIPVIVSTYNEPLITAEWAAEIFALACGEGIRCGFVSNGFASPEAVDFLQPWTRLFKVDLKCFNDKNYRALGGRLKDVLDTIERLKARGFWLEIVTLVVPGFNDGDSELRAIASFIASVSPDIPWHVTAFHPAYELRDTPATRPDDLLRAWRSGREAGLHFVYAGNLPGRTGECENTFCPGCGAELITRRGFHILANHLRDGACPECSHNIPGIWA